MKDLVYIYKAPRSGNEIEMRYSLRSAEKNLRYGRVFVIGDLPTFARGLIHVPHEGPTSKFENGVARILAAAHDERISEDFILMNDDFFIMQPFDEVPYLWTSKLGTYAKRKKIRPDMPDNSRYFKMILAAIELLGPNAKMFQAHFPIVYNKKLLRRLERKYQLPNGVSLRTLYCNEYGIAGQYQRIDFKATTPYELTRYIDKPYMSTGDLVAQTKRFKEMMQAKFPDPSSYEALRLPSSGWYAAKDFEYFGKVFRAGDLITVPVTETFARKAGLVRREERPQEAQQVA